MAIAVLCIAPIWSIAKDASVLEGRVDRWLPNPNGFVEGLLLDDGTQVILSPNLSLTALNELKAKDRIEVRGEQVHGRQLIRAHSIRNLQSGVVVHSEEEPRKHPPIPRSALSAMQANGSIRRLLYSKRGDVNGVLLSEGSVVRFPPDVGRHLRAWLQLEHPLFARGWGVSSPYGIAFEATRMGPAAEGLGEVFHAPGR